MRPSSSTSSDAVPWRTERRRASSTAGRARTAAARIGCAAALAGVAIFALASPARAQPCCAGSTALTPGRLSLHELALAGVQVRGADVFGSFDTDRRFIGSPKGTAEADFEEDLVGAVRALHDGQVSLLVPFVETWRRAPTRSEAGGGFGDLQLAARWDFTRAGESVRVPGIAALAGVVLPTGRTPESASHPLATDATGTGSFQGSIGMAAEQTFGHVLVSATGTLTIRSAREIAGVDYHPGAQLAAIGAAGYLWDSGAALAFTASYTASFESSADGRALPGSGRAGTRVGLAGGLPLADWWRLQGSFFLDPPIRYLGHAQPAALGLTATLIRTWS